MKWSKPLTFYHKSIRKIQHKCRDILKATGTTKKDLLKYYCASAVNNTPDMHVTYGLHHYERTDPLIHRTIVVPMESKLLMGEMYYHDVTSIYFADARLKPFLESMPYSRDVQAVNDFIDKFGKTIDGEKTLLLHFRIPNEDEALSIVAQRTDDQLRVLFLQGEFFDVLLVPFRLDKNDKPGSSQSEKALSLLFNYIYYVSTFPTMLVDGKPKEADPDADHAVAKKFTLKVSNEIRVTGKDKQTRCTHFRRGHFRHLTSDFYKDKKGEWVFVHSALIQGSPAKTLLADEAH